MSSDATEPPDDKTMPLLDHLVELRMRLIISIVALLLGFGGCYVFAQEIYEFLTRPLAEILGADRRMIYTGLTEAFFTYVKVSFFAGAFLAFPVIATQLWLFIAPGLYKHERGAFLPFLFATPVLFFAGGALAYYVVFPMAFKFFVGFESRGIDGGLPIQLEARVEEYLSLVMTLVFAFGVSFQLPVVLTLLARIGVIDGKFLVRQWRYAVVLAFVIAAVLTPPDIISQVSLAIPLMLLYGLSIIMVRGVDRGRAKREAALSAELDALAAGKDVVPPAP